MSRKVHQIAFNDSGVVKLRGYLRGACRSVADMLPDHEHTLWTLPAARLWLAEHYPGEVLEAFDSLVPYAYKGDLFKYCLLERLGGWIVDLGVTLLENPAGSRPGDGEHEFVIFRATGMWSPPWNCSVALLYARAGHPVFATTIAHVVRNCQEHHYGHTPLMPTMSPFGHAIAVHHVCENVRYGDVVDVFGKDYKRGFKLRPGAVVAARKPAKVGDVKSIGLSGGNNYARLWEDRKVYR
jgi:mannosyltransferase OCH1-like enzyme